jgi:hypothetical protein
MANRTAPSEHQIKLLFMGDSLLSFGIQKKLLGCGAIGYPTARDVKKGPEQKPPIRDPS